MSPKQVDKAAARLRTAVEEKVKGDPDGDVALAALDLAIGAARNLAILAAK